MAAKTAQLGSFCGGSSKLVDSAFVGMEESVNMYPETVTATDTYTQKMLKSIEGFSEFVGEDSFPQDYRNNMFSRKFFVASRSPLNSPNAGGPVVYCIANNYLHRVYKDGTVARIRFTRENDSTFIDANDEVSFTETSGDPAFLVVCCKVSRTYGSSDKINSLWVCQLDGEDDTTDWRPQLLELPDAYDHEGKISPTKLAFLNYRIIVNDEGHDYIYWSELNKPDGVDNSHAFQQKLTRYTYTKTDGTQVTAADNQFYAPAYGTYVENTLQATAVWMAALNNVKADFKADNIKSLVSLDKEFIVFGSSSLQLYQWQESQYCPFISTSKTSNIGLRNDESVAVINNTAYFLGSGATGENCVFKMNASGLSKISTIAIEQRIAGVSEKDKSYAFCYSYKGHTFFVLTFAGENDNFTVCYDETESVWHTRSSIDQYGNMNKWDARYAIQCYDSVLFTSSEEIGLFKFDKDSFVDPAGRPIPRIRTTGIKFDGGNDIIGHSLELITDNGATKNLELDPRIMLQVSHDGGFTWSSEKWARAGKMGLYNFRTLFDGLGTGSKFAFRVKVTDPAPFNIATAIFTYTPCKNRLF